MFQGSLTRSSNKINTVAKVVSDNIKRLPFFRYLKTMGSNCISFKYILRKVDYIMFTLETGTRINKKEKVHAFYAVVGFASSQKEAEERLEYMSYFFSHFKSDDLLDFEAHNSPPCPLPSSVCQLMINHSAILKMLVTFRDS